MSLAPPIVVVVVAGLLLGGEAIAAGLGLRLPSTSQQRLPAASGFTSLQDASDISPNVAAERAQRLNGGGKILAVVAVPGGYKVKLLKDGEVKIVFVPD